MTECKTGNNCKCCRCAKFLMRLCLVIVLLAALDMGVAGICGAGLIATLSACWIKVINITVGVAAILLIAFKVLKKIKKCPCGCHEKHEGATCACEAKKE